MRNLTILAVAIVLTGCVLPPKDQPHPKELSADQVGLTGAAVAAANEDWWRSFNDPQLDRLMQRGLKDSPTLAEAQARVGEALSEVQLAESSRLPQANFDASAFYQHAPANFLVPPPLAGHSFWMGQAGASLGWDLDFWGKQADAVRTARALNKSAELEVEDARLMLSGAIAQAYIEFNRQRALADIAQRSEEQRQNIVDITRRRVAAGLDTRLELRQAEGQLPQARVVREQALAAAELSKHELATLIGEGAQGYGAIQPPTFNLDAALPVPSELPFNLLARRPDVLAARLHIEAADAERLAAKAAFYPDVNLKALAGIGAFGMSNLVNWNARGLGGGPAISLPLFDGGRLKAEYRGREAALDGAVAAYNDTVLHAVQETADQITRLSSLARERTDQQLTVESNEAAYRLAEERYRAGLASYLTVLNAETQVLTARQTMVDITSNQALARITLLLAVGGNFDSNRGADASHTPTPATSISFTSQVSP